MLSGKTRGDFWSLLQSLGITLLVGREYEHFVMALTVRAGRRFVTYMPLPHPSGIAVDRRRGTVFIASTRNPNQIYRFRPLAGMSARKDRPKLATDERPLMLTVALFLPGSLYIHDLAIIDGDFKAAKETDGDTQANTIQRWHPTQPGPSQGTAAGERWRNGDCLRWPRQSRSQ